MRKRRLPQRSCVVCRTTAAKRSLMRVVRTPEGKAVVDPRGKLSGRGAYLCPWPECFRARRVRDALERALGMAVDDEEWSRLEAELDRLAAERRATLMEEQTAGNGSKERRRKCV